MGYQVRRVAIDFDWPLDEPWIGFCLPVCDDVDEGGEAPCSACDTSGWSPKSRSIIRQWHGSPEPFDPVAHGYDLFAEDDPLVISKAVRDFTVYNHLNGIEPVGEALATQCREVIRHWNSSLRFFVSIEDIRGMLRRANKPEAETFTVTDWKKRMSETLDGVYEYHLPHVRAEREGRDPACACCKGKSVLKMAAEGDVQAGDEPPVGDGWQLWETVTAGSPVTPVFATSRALAEHLVDTGRSGSRPASREDWITFVEGPGWAPTLSLRNGKVASAPFR